MASGWVAAVLTFCVLATGLGLVLNVALARGLWSATAFALRSRCREVEADAAQLRLEFQQLREHVAEESERSETARRRAAAYESASRRRRPGVSVGEGEAPGDRNALRRSLLGSPAAGSNGGGAE